MSRRLFTSESVTEGHPDKICDQISDGVLDALLAKDPNSRVACETCTTTGMILVMGEITTEAYVDVEKIVRETLTEIGYLLHQSHLPQCCGGISTDAFPPVAGCHRALSLNHS